MGSQQLSTGQGDGLMPMLDEEEKLRFGLGLFLGTVSSVCLFPYKMQSKAANQISLSHTHTHMHMWVIDLFGSQCLYPRHLLA